METEIAPLELNPEIALFRGEVDLLVALSYKNERPLLGLAGLLDWYFQGAFSAPLRRGAITGDEGECVYLPVTRKEKTYRVILAGAGLAREPGARDRGISEKTIRTLNQNLTRLKIDRIGISSADFGGVDLSFFTKKFSGLGIRVLH